MWYLFQLSFMYVVQLKSCGPLYSIYSMCLQCYQNSYLFVYGNNYLTNNFTRQKLIRGVYYNCTPYHKECVSTGNFI